MKIVCVVCNRQALPGPQPPDDEYVTTMIGARAGFLVGECFCGHCAVVMDENGLFPEERAQADAMLAEREKE